jgi:hypothetical protein
MGNPVIPIVDTTFDANQQHFAGSRASVYFIPGGFIPTQPSVVPTHALSVQNKTATASKSSAKFTGGLDSVAAVAYQKTISVTDYTLLVDGVSTLTVGPNTYTFKTTATTSSEITIGASNNACASNIAARLITDIVALGLSAVSASTNVVTLIGNTSSGANFTLSTNQSNALAIVTTVTGNAAVAGAAASIVIRAEGNRKRVGTRNTLVINLVTVGTNIPYRATFIYPINVENETNNAVVMGLKAVLDAAITGSTSFNSVLPNGGRFTVSSRNVSESDLSASLQDIFGSAVNFSVTTDTLTLTADNVGASGNNLALETEITNSPGDIIKIVDGVPVVNAQLVYAGATSDFTITPAANVIPLEASDFSIPYGEIRTGTSLGATFSAKFDNNIDLQAQANDGSNVTRDDKNKILLFNAADISNFFGLVLVIPSKIISGAFDLVVLYRVRAKNSPLVFDRVANGGINFDLSIFTVGEGGAAAFGYWSQAETLE